MTTTTTRTTRPVTVAELQRAYRDVLDGRFRRHPIRTPPADETWHGPALPVVGASTGSGASTFALALATAAGHARLVDCAGPASALAGAATAELGHHHDGWVRGRRGQVLLERPAAPVATAHPPTTPEDYIGAMAVIDIAAPLETVLAGHSWVADLLRRPGPIVVTATTTVPGFRRLEQTLTLLRHRDVVVTTGSPSRRHRDRAAAHAWDQVCAAHDLRGRVVTVPLDPRLHVHGIDSTPLPAGVLRTARHALSLTTATRKAPR